MNKVITPMMIAVAHTHRLVAIIRFKINISNKIMISQRNRLIQQSAKIRKEVAEILNNHNLLQLLSISLSKCTNFALLKKMIITNQMCIKRDSNKCKLKSNLTLILTSRRNQIYRPDSKLLIW